MSISAGRFSPTARAGAVVYWNRFCPPETRTLADTSAAAIAAAGFYRLCRVASDPMKGHFYWSAANRILRPESEYTGETARRWVPLEQR